MGISSRTQIVASGPGVYVVVLLMHTVVCVLFVMCVCVPRYNRSWANIASCLYIVQVGTCCPNTNRVDATDHA